MPVLHAVVEHPYARFLHASLVAYAHYCMLSRPTKQAFLRRHPPTACIAERRIYREQIPREDNLTGNRTAVGAPESRHGLHPCRRRVLFRRHLFQHILSHICIGVRLRKSLAQQRLIQCYAGQDRLCQRFHLLCGLVSLSPGQQSSTFSCLSNNAFSPVCTELLQQKRFDLSLPLCILHRCSASLFNRVPKYAPHHMPSYGRLCPRKCDSYTIGRPLRMWRSRSRRWSSEQIPAYPR